MSSIDDRFREGLGDRRPDVPQDLWAKIAARKAPIPEGEGLDHLFADKLAQRQAPVPAGMWARIVAARRPAAYRSYAALLLLLFAAGLTYLLWAGPQVPGAEPAAGPRAGATAPQIARSQQREVEPAAVVSTDAVPNLPFEQERATDLANGSLVNVADNHSPITHSHSAPADAPERAPASVVDERAVPLVAVSPLPFTDPDALVDRALPLPDLSAAAAPFRASRRRFELEGLIGAAYAHQSFGAGAEGARPLRDAREVSEFPTASFQVSLRLRYRLNERFRVLTGLTYAEIRNRLEYEAVRVQQQMSLERTTNRLQLLELPLLASYEVPGRRLRLNVNAGPIINLTTRVRGRYIDPAFAEPRALQHSGNYRSNIGVGWTASLTTTYFLGKERTTQLLLEPFFKHYPGSFTRPGAALPERYWMAGLQLGLRKPLR